jgi:hypothetical protein
MMDLLGLELWNRKYDGWAPSRTAPGLLEQTSIVPFVGMDFHTQRQLFPLTMALDIAPGQIGEEDVIRCLRARRCEARAFGVSLNHVAFGKMRSLFQAAERSRKLVASLAK